MASSDPRRPVDFEGRLLAEAIRVFEEVEGGLLEDGAANAQARATEGGLEEKVVCRARAHRLAPEMLAALGRFRLTLRVACGLGAALAFSAGLATAHTALTVPEGQPVAFHWALLALLGVETLTLLLWIALSFMGGRALQAPSLGGVTFVATCRLAGWFDRGTAQTVLLQGAAAVFSRGAIARWTLGAITHGLWGAFLLGALVMALLILSAKQVAFGWETTILSEASYLPLTQALAALPQLVGFPTPSLAEIAASRWEGQGPLTTEAAGAWAGLLIGSLLLYGLAPRALLFTLSLIARRRALRGFRLDLMRPDYVRLREALMPRFRQEGLVEADRLTVPAEAVPTAPLPATALAGPVALLGVEIGAGNTPWPPDLPGIPCQDLGLVDSRKDREQAMSALSSAAPSLVLVAVSLLTTPDRGIAAVLEQARRESDAPMVLLLTEGASLERRHAEPARRQRYQDWWRLAGELGIPANWVIEVDFAQPAAGGLPELAALLDPGQP
jgi:hypothetical protein